MVTKKEGDLLNRPHAVGAYAIRHPSVGQRHPNADIDRDGPTGANTRYSDHRDRVVTSKLAKSALDRGGRWQILHHGGRLHF